MTSLILTSVRCHPHCLKSPLRTSCDRKSPSSPQLHGSLGQPVLSSVFRPLGLCISVFVLLLGVRPAWVLLSRAPVASSDTSAYLGSVPNYVLSFPPSFNLGSHFVTPFKRFRQTTAASVRMRAVCLPFDTNHNTNCTCFSASSCTDRAVPPLPQ